MAKAEYYDEAPKFHDRMEKFFAGYSQQPVAGEYSLRLSPSLKYEL